jgi:hypothetical protein
LCHWKALYRAGKLDAPAPRVHAPPASATFLPVSIAPAVRTPRPTPRDDADARSVVHLVLASGATLRIETGALDAALVCALVLEDSPICCGRRIPRRGGRS